VHAVLHEIMAYEKRTGRKPAVLVLIDREFRDRFFAELYEATMVHDSLDFKSPGQFYGIPFYSRDVWIYGGSAKWLLCGDYR
jgi:hypothetical protein